MTAAPTVVEIPALVERPAKPAAKPRRARQPGRGGGRQRRQVLFFLGEKNFGWRRGFDINRAIRPIRSGDGGRTEKWDVPFYRWKRGRAGPLSKMT